MICPWCKQDCEMRDRGPGFAAYYYVKCTNKDCKIQPEMTTTVVDIPSCAADLWDEWQK